MSMITIMGQQKSKSLCLAALLVSLAGCATTGLRESYVWRQQGEYQIITRNDDLYLEKLDGSESRQLTHTPNYPEWDARFVGNGEYIVYGETNGSSIDTGRLYIIPANGDDSERKEISQNQMDSLR